MKRHSKKKRSKLVGWFKSLVGQLMIGLVIEGIKSLINKIDVYMVYIIIELLKGGYLFVARKGVW
jgi:hypothetical protein